MAHPLTAAISTSRADSHAGFAAGVKVATSNLSPSTGASRRRDQLHDEIRHKSNSRQRLEFLRNKELNANTFFNNKNGVPRPAFTQNTFGANLAPSIHSENLQWPGQNFLLREL